MDAILLHSSCYSFYLCDFAWTLKKKKKRKRISLSKSETSVWGLSRTGNLFATVINLRVLDLRIQRIVQLMSNTSCLMIVFYEFVVCKQMALPMISTAIG
jgi:hypothetical protein